MIFSLEMLRQKYANYANPDDKIYRLVKSNQLFPISKGIYEDDRSTSGQYLASSIYGPSYLSFDYALAYYGLIPETAYVYTSATFEKKKKKIYTNMFGTFTYADVPSNVFPLGIVIIENNGYVMHIATPEKALCDKLYSLPPVKNQKELKALLFENLRIDETILYTLNFNDIISLSEQYKSNNVRALARLIRRNSWTQYFKKC